MEDENIEKLYYTMGEVSTMLDVAPSLLRFWEKEFSEIHPKKNKKGNRLYTKEDIETLKLIYFLTRKKGLTLSGARERLKNQKGQLNKNKEVLESLQKVRDFLIELKESI
ncbi:MAG: MerR family transcriptional regulator [Flavobacteriales bacterium]|nr:MerR family transcriptional regulator [Flavobacteriales bacterium]